MGRVREGIDRDARNTSVSDSFGAMMSVLRYTSSGKGQAGAGSRNVVTPSPRAVFKAWAKVSTGPSNWQASTAAPPISGRARSTCAGLRRLSAPRATAIRLSPWASMMMKLMPEWMVSSMERNSRLMPISS